MKNEGWKTFSTPSVPVGFSIFDKNEKLICTWIGNYEGLGAFPPQTNVTQTWNQHYCQDIMNNQQVSPGNYLIVANHFGDYSIYLPNMKIAIME